MEQKSNVRDCENCKHYKKMDNDMYYCHSWECDYKPKSYPAEKIEAAIAEIKKERDKSYECEAIGHGWGMQSALEILRRHLDEDKRNNH